MAGEAGLVQRLVAWLSALKVSEAPAARPAYFFEAKYIKATEQGFNFEI
jgi:hypothetical protein